MIVNAVMKKVMHSMWVGACLCAMMMSIVAASSSPEGPMPGLCCKTCQEGYQKYYSIPKGSVECGECCLQPSRYEFWKKFEPALLPGDCKSKDYTVYKDTERDGIGPLAVTNDRYIQAGICPTSHKAVYADMHDGDKKEVNAHWR